MDSYFLIVILNNNHGPDQTNPRYLPAHSDLYGDSPYDYTQRTKPVRSQPPPTYKPSRQQQQK
jgi:hypothetical protein